MANLTSCTYPNMSVYVINPDMWLYNTCQPINSLPKIRRKHKKNKTIGCIASMTNNVGRIVIPCAQ